MRKVLKGIKSRISKNKPSGESTSSEEDIATLRHAFETTAADRDRLSQELETYRHAFETTEADRDRLQTELDSCKHALETTTADRDRIQARLDSLRAAEQQVTEPPGETLEAYKHAYETTRQDSDNLAKMFAEAVQPLDAGYFRLDMLKYLRPENAELADKLAESWDRDFIEGAYKKIVDEVLEHTPIRLALPLPDDYLLSVAAYMLSSFFVRRREFEKAAGYAEHFHYNASVDGTDFLPYDMQQGSRLALYQQHRALALNAPGAIVVSLMKSGSAFLADAISQVFGVPILRVTMGEGMRSTVITRWVDQLAQGGATTHDHFQALPVNLQALSDSKANEIWILIRDPRDTAFSLRKMEEDYVLKNVNDALRNHDQRGADLDVRRQKDFITNTDFMSKWIEMWLDASNDDAYDIDIKFLKYADVTTDLVGTFQTIFPNHFDEAAEQKTKNFLERFEQGSIDRRNYRKGTGQEWREAYPQEVRDEAWKRIADSVKELLHLVR